MFAFEITQIALTIFQLMQKILFILFVLLTLAGCRSGQNAQKLFDRAESLMDCQPDSALKLLYQFDPDSLSSRSQRARYALLFSCALDKNGIDLSTDSIIRPAVTYFAHHGSKREKALTSYYLGRIRDNSGDAGEAARLMLEAEKYAIQAQQTGLLGLIYNCRGNLYFYQYSFTEALDMYNKADSCFQLEGKMSFAAFMIKSKAKTYYMLKKLDASIYEYKSALALFDSLGNREQVCMISSTMAYQMRDDGHISTDSIKRFLIHNYMQHNAGEKIPVNYPVWAWIYLQENKIDSARYYAYKALSTNNESGDRQCGLLALASQIEEASGNYQAATANWKESYSLLDSLSSYEKENLIQRADERFENKELQHRNEMLHLRSKLVASISLLIFTIILFVTIFMLRRWRRIIRRNSQENEKYKRFVDHLNDDYNALQARYTQLTEGQNSDLMEPNLLNAIEKRLVSLQEMLDLAYSGGCKPQTFFTRFKAYAATINDDECAFTDLQYLINKRHNGIIDYLRREHPSLTNSELSMLSMVLFGFSLDCIRLIFNHENPDSIYSRRTKIREKLLLPPRSKLEKYLFELAEQLKNENPEKNDNSDQNTDNQ